MKFTHRCSSGQPICASTRTGLRWPWSCFGSIHMFLVYVKITRSQTSSVPTHGFEALKSSGAVRIHARFLPDPRRGSSACRRGPLWIFGVVPFGWVRSIRVSSSNAVAKWKHRTSNRASEAQTNVFATLHRGAAGTDKIIWWRQQQSFVFGTSVAVARKAYFPRGFPVRAVFTHVEGCLKVMTPQFGALNEKQS